MRKSFVWFIAVLTTVTILSANLSNDHKYEVRADQVTLQIDASNVINAMDPQMRGSTIGIWTNQHYYPTANPKLVNMLKEAGMKLLRYPAGSEADDTMFERSNTGTIFSKRFVLTNSDSLTNLRDQYSPGASIGITELSPVAGGNSVSGVSDTLGNALWYGDISGRLAYYGVDFANQFLAISEPQKYAMSDYKYNIRPSWYTYIMYNRYFGIWPGIICTKMDNDFDCILFFECVHQWCFIL